MKTGTADSERGSGIYRLIGGVLFLAAMVGMWWLEATNREGTHDAQLLPFFALIPLPIGVYHLIRARLHHT